MASRLGVLGIISVVLCSVYCEEDWVAMRMYRADAEETDALGQGSCQYGYTSEGWPNGLYASISRDDTKWSPNEMRGCGTCLEVSCQDVEACGPDPTKSITVVITSECPTCSGTELQLSAAAFDALVHTQTGRAQSRVRMVPCSPPGNIQIRVSDARDTKGGWLKLEVESLAGSGILFGVEVRGKDDDSWRPMTQTSGAAWEMSMLPFPPLDVRVTASDGQVVLPVAIPAIKAGLYPTEVQLAPTEQAPNPRAEAPFRLDRDPEVVGDGVVRFATPLPPAKGPAVETMPVSPAQGPAAEESPPSRATPRPGPPLNANEDAGAPAVDWSSRRLDETGAPENSPGVPLLQRRQDNEVEGGEGTVDAGSAQGEELPFIERAPMTEDEMPVDAAPSLEDQVASLNGQPGVVPAPVSFQPLKITRMSRGPDTRGYISSKQVQDDYNVTREGGCPTLQDLLGSSPDLSIWFQLLRFSGLVNMLQDGNAVVTLFVPVNSAFEAVLNAPSFLAAPETLAEFVRTRPELVPILTSYSTASHLWPLASLFEGEQVPTMASADKTNKIPIHVEAGDRLRGVGSSATILQGNLLACGPAVVHVIDQVLLPFGLEKQAIDAISDSQVKSSPTPVSPPAV